MITTRMAQIGLMVLLTAGSVSAVMAGSPNDFVEKAAQGGIAEIESSKVALEIKSYHTLSFVLLLLVVLFVFPQ